MISKKNIKQNLINIPGWRTNRKLVVFESDDWGSIRMPSLASYQNLLKNGIRVDLCPYNRFDNLASKKDLHLLFSILDRYSDINGNHPVFTANTIVANPDFVKIRLNNFEEYFYEPFTETLSKQFNREDVFSIWLMGMESRVFYPQLHGREHVNPIIWMDLLKNNHTEIRDAFKNGTYGLSRVTSPNIKKLHLAALLYSNDIEKKYIENSIREGAKLFNDIFGYKTSSFIAPVYIWDIALEKTLKEVGIKFIQGGNSHNNINFLTNKTFRVKRHFIGERNNLGQIFLVRNCFFEPSLIKNFRIKDTLKEIETAFRWHKPAIISSHRVNYIGSLDSDNRDKNLVLLDSLLENIKKKWPNVEFLNSVELGEIIKYS